MAEALVLKKNDSPTYFNKEALIGTLLFPVVGTVIGAMIGKSRMEEEAKNGKVVTDKPSFWNKDTLLGGLVGNLVGCIGAAIAFFAVTGKSLTSFATHFENVQFVADNAHSLGGSPAVTELATSTLADMVTMGAIGLVVSGVVLAGSTLIGAYIGGKSGQARQTAEYEESKQQTIVNHLSHNVSPEVGKAVEYSMEHNKEWGKQVAEDRLLAQAQGHHHP